MTNELDLAAFNISAYDFTFGDKVKPTTDDYKQASVWAMDGSNGSINYNKNYVYSGDYSYVYTPSGNHPSNVATFTKDFAWNSISAISFQVYNPTENTYFLNAGVKATTGTTSAVVGNVTYTIPAQTWTKITVVLNGLALGDTNEIRFNSSYDANLGGVPNSNSGVASKPNTAKYREFRLYMDDFKVETIDFTSDDYLWTVGTGKFATVTDSKSIANGSVSANVKFVGTWETAYFTHATTIDWTKVGKLTFQVYNPNSFDVVLGLGESWASFVAYKGQWTTVEVTDFSVMVEGKGLMIRAGHTCSLTVDGVTYTNPTKTDNVYDGWQDEFWPNGLYFDNFVVTYK